jgi:hypothetical protein
VANGTEKYMVIGNFKSDAAIVTSTINGPFVQQEWCDVCIDDVSCIEMDVAAYAGPDQWVVPGDSVYIGRENDWAIDPYCTWFKLPDMTNAIDTVSGMWVKPVVTTTYVVKQELECNSLKWDTVVVYINPLGVSKLNAETAMLKVYPVPAADELFVDAGKQNAEIQVAEVFNLKGEKIKTVEISESEISIRINLERIGEGIYYLRVKLKDNEWFGRTFVVEK